MLQPSEDGDIAQTLHRYMLHWHAFCCTIKIEYSEMNGIDFQKWLLFINYVKFYWIMLNYIKIIALEIQCIKIRYSTLLFVCLSLSAAVTLLKWKLTWILHSILNRAVDTFVSDIETYQLMLSRQMFVVYWDP
jgi:hypothetical protein